MSALKTSSPGYHEPNTPYIHTHNSMKILSDLLALQTRVADSYDDTRFILALPPTNNVYPKTLPPTHQLQQVLNLLTITQLSRVYRARQYLIDAASTVRGLTMPIDTAESARDYLVKIHDVVARSLLDERIDIAFGAKRRFNITFPSPDGPKFWTFIAPASLTPHTDLIVALDALTKALQSVNPGITKPYGVDSLSKFTPELVSYYVENVLAGQMPLVYAPPPALSPTAAA